MDIRIGISGWVYPAWRGVFYPKDLPQKKELFFASRQLNSIEINGSFYSYQKPSTYKHWYAETPENFLFALKGPQYITHIQRLKEPRQPLANFFASGPLYLKEKLGPILWQLPPNFLCNLERLEDFFKLLPKSFSSAAALANISERFTKEYGHEFQHDSRPLRHCLEVRHHSFENPDFIHLLRQYNIALVFGDSAGKWPYMEDITSDFIYLRLHGDKDLYASGYDDATLLWWADRVGIWAHKKQPLDALTMSEDSFSINTNMICIYFDNDIKVRAPQDAETLMNCLKRTSSLSGPP
ncbi:MAG: DUF72 domain-containing protein [Bacillota bacterium]